MNKKKLLIIYITTSIIWIFGTNFLVDHYAPAQITSIIEHSKELLYVIITGWFIYFYVTKSEELSIAKEEEKRLSTLINSMVDIVIFKDGEGNWIEANKFGLKLFQIEGIDYRGKNDSELAEFSLYGDALKYCKINDEEIWIQGEINRVEEVIQLQDGGIKTFDTMKVPLFHPDGSRKGLVVIGRDITERNHVKMLLKESEQRYKSLFDYNPDIVYMLDLEGVITNLNPQFEKITGVSAADTVGKHIKYLLPLNAGRNEILQIISDVITDKVPKTFETNFQHYNGNTVILQCASVPMIINGEIAGIIGYAQDITQIRETEERLRQTEKLSVVGELAASVAHEIRNPLTSLKGFVQLLKMEDENHQGYYKIMLDELNRINHIVGELLLLAKPQKVKYTKVRIENILCDVISLLRTEASLYGIQIKLDYEERGFEIECEPNQLKQLFINIIKNAIEASTNGDNVTISLQQIDQANISITIKDSGCGISKERLKRLGEPFYSSKEKGTGLGLTVSYKIVQSHNGKIEFNSEANVGTEVLIEFPYKSKPEYPDGETITA